MNKNSECDKAYRKVFQMEKKIMEQNLRLCCLVDSVSHNDGRSHCINNPIENCSPLMWAHYANSHRGICIEYEITPESLNLHNDNNHILRLCDVRYRSHKAMSDYITIDNALLAKGECWEYENETRMVYYTTDKSEWLDSNGKVKDYITLSGFKIKVVYMGYRIPDYAFDGLRNLLSHNDIDLYKMEFLQDDITRLISNKVCKDDRTIHPYGLY